MAADGTPYGANPPVALTNVILEPFVPVALQTAGVVQRGIESFGSDFVKEDWGIARLNSTISSTFTNELRYQIGRDFEFQIGQNPVSGEPVSAQRVSPQVFIGGVGNFTFGKPNFLDRRAFPTGQEPRRVNEN